MVGNHIRAGLRAPLAGNRQMLSEQRGPFTLRIHPEHVAECRAAIVRRDLLADMDRFRRLEQARRNRDLLGI